MTITARDPSTARRRHLVPWWLTASAGVACAVVGVVITTRPFTSLSVLIVLVAIGFAVTGLATIAGADRAPRRWLAWGLGIGWLVAAVVVLAWPGLTTFGLAVGVGITLIAGGIVDVVGGRRGTADERLAAVIGGIASVVFGVLALAWPDVTVLVLAVVFGIRTIVFGLRLAVSAVRHRDGRDKPTVERPPGRLRRSWNVVVAVVALVLALALGAVSAKLHEAEPAVDAFYTPPADVPAQAGALLRAEPFTRAIPDDARAWRILYTTTRADGVPATASALVVAPSSASSTPRPVIAWAHGTTGIARRCAPSVLPDPWTSGAFFSLDRVLDEGWVLVAPDYVGLGTPSPHPYLVGDPTARSVLDAVRAARQLGDVRLADQTVVWGHSQGGGAALWTGVIAPTYAPDVPLAGVAALAPASDLLGLVDHLGDIRGGSIFAAYVLAGYAATYPDVRVGDYVRLTARTTFAALADRCLNASTLVSALSSVATGMTMFSADASTGPLAERLAQNAPTAPIAAPLLIAQGETDSLIQRSVQAEYVAARCAAGQAVDYRTYAGRDHVPLVEPDSPLLPELLRWTEDRFTGAPATSTCPAR